MFSNASKFYLNLSSRRLNKCHKEMWKVGINYLFKQKVNSIRRMVGCENLYSSPFKLQKEIGIYKE